MSSLFLGGGAPVENREVRIGIGGWEHEALDSVLYGQQGLTSLEKLERYARCFEIVEVRPTFWDETLNAEDAKSWVGAVSGNPLFRFSVKLHREFTHKRKIPTELRHRVRGLLGTLDGAGRLAALLVQLPFSFTNTSSNRFFLVRLAEVFHGFPIHVEFRHSSWHTPSLRPFLEEHGVHLVSADMPRIRQYMPFHTNIFGESTYVRLHGRNEKGWLLNGLDSRYDYLYNAREVIELRRRVDTLVHSCRQIAVVFNNTTGGRAVVNAFQLRSAIRGNLPLEVPSAALKAFPQLHQIADLTRPEQTLFESAGFRTAI